MINFTKQTFKPAIAIPKPISASAFSGRVLSFRSEFGSEPLKIHKGGRDCCYRLFLVDRSGGEMELVRKLSRGCFSDPPKNGQEVEIESVEGGEDVFDVASADSKVQPEHLVIMDRSGGEMELVRKLSRGCFSDPPKNGQEVELESVEGGEDVFDVASADSKVQPEHLVIMVNGLIGSAADWRYTAKQFVRRLPDKVVVHCSECNHSRLTFDGVDRMGERLAEEVVEVVKRWPGMHKISFVAHSLGGLVARYAVGRLYGSSTKVEVKDFNGFCSSVDTDGGVCEKFDDERIAGLEPMNFITVATPHLGSRGHKQLPLLCGLPLLEKGVSQTAHWIVGRSGKHLFLTDNDDGKPPLLLRMANDSDDLKFISALRSFKRRVAYANANYDHVVGWSTSSIRRQNELPKSNFLGKDLKYPHIVHVDQETAEDVKHKASFILGTETIDLEEEMIRGLTQVPWERIDVSFHKSKQRYVAHNTIQVKSYWMNSDGADVIQHLIDNFLL